MRSLKTVINIVLLLGSLVFLFFAGVVPAIYGVTAAKLDVSVESEADLETLLRQSIESDRQSLELTKSMGDRRSVKWSRPDFSRLPKHLIALYVTGIGCPDYFRSPREVGVSWYLRLIASVPGKQLEGDGACELILARSLAQRLGLTETLDVTVMADKIHKRLSKDQLVAYSLHSMWFAQGVIGVEHASEVAMQRPLADLTLAELAEFQLAIPPWDYWSAVVDCQNAPQIRQARDTLLRQLVTHGQVSEEMARTANSQPIRCLSVKR